MTTRTASPVRPRAADAKERQERRYWGSIEPPKSKASFFSAVTAPAPEGEDATVATIRLYGPIDSWGGWWGISAEDVARVLDALPTSVEQIVLRINSPGGEVWEAMAILNMLGAHSARVTAVVDGIAASAASFIAAGCDETVMSKGSQMMIHSPSSIAWGNASEMRKVAAFLDVVEASSIEIYTEKAGDQDWATMLADETWLTAAATVELGLADRIGVVMDAGAASTVGVEEDEADTVILVDDEPDDAVTDRIRAVAASARASAPKPPSSSEPGTPIRKENVVTNDAPTAAVDERLGTPEPVADAETASTAAAPTAAQPTNPGLLSGTVAVDANVWEQVQRDARAGAQARAEQDKTRRDGIIASAIAAGRIAPTSSDHFRKMLDTDETGTAAAIASLQPNTALPVDEIGHAVGLTDDDTAYPSNWKR
ncbi:ATP-dependent protease ClpP protease subunit [Microbacterium testaceum]|uniref:head maturation protease, ClpP-related n=1 Tax=Microbacterium testaceum TaxID=2033 RepID=UPI0027808034|nr:head maturation protease, ClpP-related [Microbacterium testaceum]MDQ1174177.1 ATP-dependent protease ClpP protease subunit [Microbacterium testaceum]